PGHEQGNAENQTDVGPLSKRKANHEPGDEQDQADGDAERESISTIERTPRFYSFSLLCHANPQREVETTFTRLNHTLSNAVLSSLSAWEVLGVREQKP